MLNENRLYSISLGVASLQDGLVGVATALSPAMAGHFKFLLHHFFVRLGLTLNPQIELISPSRQSVVNAHCNYSCTSWLSIKLSSPAESHRQTLREPDVNLSIH